MIVHYTFGLHTFLQFLKSQYFDSVYIMQKLAIVHYTFALHTPSLQFLKLQYFDSILIMQKFPKEPHPRPNNPSLEDTQSYGSGRAALSGTETVEGAEDATSVPPVPTPPPTQHVSMPIRHGSISMSTCMYL